MAMFDHVARTRCPGCRHVVPTGRWCNRCGAPLVQVAVPRVGSSRRAPPRRVLVALTGLAAVVAVLWIASARPRSEGPEAPADAAVILAEDAPTPSPTTAPPEDRVDVVCSDLRRHSIPVDVLETTEPGALVHLAFGPCVVMGPEGAAVP